MERWSSALSVVSIVSVEGRMIFKVCTSARVCVCMKQYDYTPLDDASLI